MGPSFQNDSSDAAQGSSLALSLSRPDLLDQLSILTAPTRASCAKQLSSGSCSAAGRHFAHLNAVLHVFGRVPGQHCALISDCLPISRAVKTPLLVHL